MRAFVSVLGALAVGGCALTGEGISRSNGEYASKFALSPQATTILANSTAALPEGAPNDAVLIYLAQRRPEIVRQQAVATATARALIMTSDALCEQYMAKFMLNSRTATSVLGISGLAFSSAGGIATPARSANLLSTLATFATGTQGQLNKTVSGDKAPELLYRSVMAIRSQERSRLLTLLESTTLGESAPGVVLAQLADYHWRCGPTVGINGLTESVEATADRAAATGAGQADSFVRSLTK